jgi:hypothetical protein
VAPLEKQNKKKKITHPWLASLLKASAHVIFCFFSFLRSPYKADAKAWVRDQFLESPKGKNPRKQEYKLPMLQKENVTPYMHVFVYHIPEYLQICAEWKIPLSFFSCQSLEKKNHAQVRLYFAKTKKGGGKLYCSPVREILEIENMDFLLWCRYGDKPEEHIPQAHSYTHKAKKN